MVIDTSRWSNRFFRFLILLGAIATFGICAWNLLTAVFRLKANFTSDPIFWLSAINCVALFFYARTMFLLWKDG